MFLPFVHAFVRNLVAVVPRCAVLVFVAPTMRRTHSTFLFGNVAMKAVFAFLMRLTVSASLHLSQTDIFVLTMELLRLVTIIVAARWDQKTLPDHFPNYLPN